MTKLGILIGDFDQLLEESEKLFWQEYELQKKRWGNDQRTKEKIDQIKSLLSPHNLCELNGHSIDSCIYGGCHQTDL
jgi:hypothetical protein